MDFTSYLLWGLAQRVDDHVRTFCLHLLYVFTVSCLHKSAKLVVCPPLVWSRLVSPRLVSPRFVSSLLFSSRLVSSRLFSSLLLSSPLLSSPLLTSPLLSSPLPYPALLSPPLLSPPLLSHPLHSPPLPYPPLHPFPTSGRPSCCATMAVDSVSVLSRWGWGCDWNSRFQTPTVIEGMRSGPAPQIWGAIWARREDPCSGSWAKREGAPSQNRACPNFWDVAGKGMPADARGRAASAAKVEPVL